MNLEVIKQVRKNVPLIHHLTNQVVMNFTANGLLSFGGAPVMAKAEEEAHNMASLADGVLLNIGTITRADIKAMILAGQAANQKGIPVVLDPVGVAATSFRTDAVNEILKEVKPTVIKGNAGELANLVDTPWETKGVESIGEGNIAEIAEKVSIKYQTTAVLTGKTDIIHTTKERITNETGHPLLAKVTGAGCLLGSILAACLTTDAPIEDQAYTAVHFYGLAASYAAANPSVQGNGTFIASFLDALSRDPGTLESVIT
ncbi:hydroxyethylthiazole kinase [Oceanobacillus piezotolerans]|uniref:Hydroxyethylthiazole kinase n=1 Tax=Oceanobacillus piezotolerans TaxID=2448030 RepID=A0A498DES0_9BACI|nr:hydroxyethylthiazole kinase [Oceanobacillus piezotolerans]RLL42019.1 hydroxyethylthiazole kinase [Oceanobacillus piezotolerans]